jgi:hypothetical protein
MGGYHEEERPLRKSTVFSLLFPRTASLTNTYQFPMSEYIKDPSVEAGWRTISHDKVEGVGAASDAANLNPDAMDEGGEAGGSDVEPDME